MVDPDLIEALETISRQISYLRITLGVVFAAFSVIYLLVNCSQRKSNG